MIHSVKIQNYKNIRDQTISLERLTVFVGANASGKTSILEAVDLAVRAAIMPDFSVTTGLEWLYMRGGSGELSILCETAGGDFSMSASPSDRAFRVDPSNVKALGEGESRTLEILFPGPLRQAIDSVEPTVFLRLDARTMAKPSYSDRTPPRLKPDGEGLASALAYMALNDPDRFEELSGFVRELVPSIKRIRFGRSPIERDERELIKIGDDSIERRTSRSYQGETILVDFQHAANIAAHTLSDGTLLILGLITVLLGPERPKVVLLDDIEHGLHPLAQENLLVAIGKIMEKFPDLQILATSHSPYLLDSLKPEQIRLMATGVDGEAICGRLVDHPRFEKWKDEMAPGEMWSLFGEKWIAEPEQVR